MKSLIFLVLFVPFTVFGQSFKDVEKLFASSLFSIKDSSIHDHYSHFATLSSKRNINRLKARYENLNATSVYIIEGYNFKTGKYSVFEQYNFSPALDMFADCRTFLNGKELKGNTKWALSFDSSLLYMDTICLGKFYPRVYRYGMGCEGTRQKEKLADQLTKKAKADGIVTESYCRVETFILRDEYKIVIKYLIPVPGQRRAEINAGMLSDWPPGLDFWLFVSPKLTGD